jgi:cyclopropane-fatty-acyl-phospholipid synthase
VTTTTISQEQFELAKERIAAAGLADRVTVLLEDYRDLRGQYDKLVSIEMIEAVGHEYLPTYFGTCASLLRPEGAALIQAITMPDDRYEQYRHSTDFIQRYIFPGSCVPSRQAMGEAIASATDFTLADREEIGLHYATTLRVWRTRFFEQIERVRALGYPERFVRMWDYYLCYCEAGFLEQYIGTCQMLLTRPGWSARRGGCA